jgi:hypothetical protein
MLPGPDTHTEKLPSSVFDVCTPTQGSREVIKAPCSKKWMALDIISSAGIGTFAVSIDEHPLWVYAVDGHYIEPLKVDVLTLANGERYSVFVQLNKPASNYGVRIASLALAQLIDTTAVLSYDDAEQSYANGSTAITSEPSINRAGGNVTSDVVFFNQAEMVSFPPQFPQPAPEVDQTFLFSLATAGSSYRWALNGTTYDHAIDNSKPWALYNSQRNESKLTMTDHSYIKILLRLPLPVTSHLRPRTTLGSTLSSTSPLSANLPIRCTNIATKASFWAREKVISSGALLQRLWQKYRSNSILSLHHFGMDLLHRLVRLDQHGLPCATKL